MLDRRIIPEEGRRAPAAEASPPVPAAPQDQLLALGRSAGNQAVARMLSPAADRALMRTRSAAGDLAADDVVDLLEDRDPPTRPRSRSAPPALGSLPLVPLPPVPLPGGPAPAERDEPSEPLSVDEDPSSAAEKPLPVAEEPAPAAEMPLPAIEVPPSAPTDVAVPTVEAPPRKPRIPKNPQPLPTHPTITDAEFEAFNVRAHAQLVRDNLRLASDRSAANEKALGSQLFELDPIWRGESKLPLAAQRAKIAAAEAAYKPLHEALEKRQKDLADKAEKPENARYKQVSLVTAKAKNMVARYEWKPLVDALDDLEARLKLAGEFDTLAKTATDSVAYLKDETRLGQIPDVFTRRTQKEDLDTIELRVKARHNVPNLADGVKKLGELLSTVGRIYSDIELRPTVEDAINEPIASPDKDAKKRAARAALKELLDNGVLRRGKLIQKYRDAANGPDHYGVEWTLEGTERIVVHSHVGPDGRANDENATHFKLRGSKLQGGKSIGMPAGWKGDVLMDPERNKNAALT